MNPLKTLAQYVADVIAPLHKYGALAVGILAALGVTPGSATTDHYTAVVAVAYAAVVHAADTFGVKAAS